MNKNVLAARRGLNESKTLGRVEPLHSTFSHHVVSAGSKNNNEPPVPANRPCPTGARYAVWSKLDSLNDVGFPRKTSLWRHICPFCLFLPHFRRLNSSTPHPSQREP